VSQVAAPEPSAGTLGSRGPGPAVGPVKAYVDIYLTMFKQSIASNFQYRVANYFYMIGMIAEPVIYLVVWSTIAVQQGGEVGGYTPGELAAYYIVWTLVRQMNIIFTPYGWEDRIRGGELSQMLLKPLFPIHWDIAGMAGWKFVVILLWLPIAAVLTLLFRPTLDPSLADIAVFSVAIWGAYLVRTMVYWMVGMASFWTTRVGPFFQLVLTVELLLSGRLVPMSLMPDWAQRLADLLPFQWCFAFPIEALVAGLPASQLATGLAMQLFWIVVGALGVRIVWHFAIRHYGAVGG
jgi:ABC-2 type transport system permease protein